MITIQPGKTQRVRLDSPLMPYLTGRVTKGGMPLKGTVTISGHREPTTANGEYVAPLPGGSFAGPIYVESCDENVYYGYRPPRRSPQAH